MDWMPQAVIDGIVVVLLISGPLVLTAAFIGLAIGILQAATQVQEQTIGSALKIIGVFTLIIFAGFWMYQYLSNYTSRTLSSAFTFIPRQTQKVVPPDAFEGEDFNASFGESEGMLEIIKSEELDLPTGDVPLSPGYVGAPETPKVPTVTKISPPSIPELPKPPVKLSLPLSDIQQLKPIVTPPEVPSQVPENPPKVEEPVEEPVIAPNDVMEEVGSPSWLE